MSHNGEEEDEDMYSFGEFHPSISYPSPTSTHEEVIGSGRSNDSGRVSFALGGQGSNLPSRRLSSRAGVVRGAIPGTRAGREGEEPLQRPMTGVVAAGYNRPGTTLNTTQRTQGLQFDPLGNRGPAPPLQKKIENGPEDMAKEIEKEVNKFLEESAVACAKGDPREGLEKAKEAVKRERKLSKFRESNGLTEQLNQDLSYAVKFNLAVMYHQCQMYAEALSTYTLLVKNKQHSQSYRLRVNMGNLYYEQKKYLMAIKMYRMALDQIPLGPDGSGKQTRCRISRNIGTAFVRMGQFSDAVSHLETVMEDSPDHRSGLNLVVCYFSLGDKEKMMRSFELLLGMRKPLDITTGEDEDLESNEDGDAAPNDALRQELRERQKATDNYIIMAAQLIAPVIEKDFATGYDWVIDTLRQAGNCNDLANEMEIAKAIAFIKHKNFSQAIDTLKAFEKKDQGMVACAYTNLSFLYFLERNFQQAERYADLALQLDRYNAKSLVNKGNCYAARGDIENAKSMYQEAVSIEADCIEAIYNLGLSYKRISLPQKALQQFAKLQAIIPGNPEVLFQIGSLYESVEENMQEAVDCYKQLLALVPTEAGVLARVGVILQDDDDSLSYQNMLDSYRYWPVNLQVVSWLATHYIKQEAYEKAIHFFQRAAQLQPTEIRWQLMVGSCHRRMGAYQQALDLYRLIHSKSPDNIECLKYLVNICNDLSLRDEAQEYVQKLRKAQTKVSEVDTTPIDDHTRSESRMSTNGNSALEAPSTDLRSVQAGNFYQQSSANKKKPAVVEDDENDEPGDHLLPL
eukprot:TRINITY_DN1846_c0_g1_i1.p1 TRINITY_DN1846_c0_g1~~TRINITY_DN1846_c0_g1_i1.p1  ORF type:complete len:797 (+),score=173.42 TRINITY_DN1846_c0_g1_i1:139-2529(+)